MQHSLVIVDDTSKICDTDNMGFRPFLLVWMVRLFVVSVLLGSQAVWLSAHPQTQQVGQLEVSDIFGDLGLDETTVDEITSSSDDDSRYDVAGYPKPFSTLLIDSASILSPPDPRAAWRGRGIGPPFLFRLAHTIPRKLRPSSVTDDLFAHIA